ncbi:ABC transporter ATP-binding protein [Lacisediminihabitans profunda]|uniref:ABC transporter ATP-binding protein n=1 Tax=Lacisediminihabitans profunda TaxID=2594790 RepID=UPI001C9CBF2B|nr:ABC transporter ATP-binding protein [Lacisediminihabitans profunda]
MNASPEPIVAIRALTKRYGAVTAVDGLDLEVRRGEVFGLLGPNGAGKTTTLECLEGLRTADSGTVLVAGLDPRRDERELRRHLGVQLQSTSLPDSIRVGEAIRLVSAWHRVPYKVGLVERFTIGALMRREYRQLSGGQKRLVHLVLALVGDPELLVLDEPTAGLDVQGRARLHDEIRSISEQGVTVLLATHDMAEAEQLCDRIAIIVRGRVVVCGTPQEVTAAGHSETRILLRTANGSLLPGSDVGAAHFVGAENGYLEWTSREVAEAVTEILARVQRAGDVVDDLRVARPSLEQRFLEVVTEAQQ